MAASHRRPGALERDLEEDKAEAGRSTTASARDEIDRAIGARRFGGTRSAAPKDTARTAGRPVKLEHRRREPMRQAGSHGDLL